MIEPVYPFVSRCVENSVLQRIAQAMSFDRYVFMRDTQSEITRKNSLVNFPRIVTG